MSDGDQGVAAMTEEDVPPVRVPVYDDRGRIIGRISVLVPRMASDSPAATGALENVVRDLLARSYFAGKEYTQMLYDSLVAGEPLPPGESASAVKHHFAAARAYSVAVFNVTMTKIAHAMPELVPRSSFEIAKTERDSAVEQLGEYRARDQATDRPEGHRLVPEQTIGAVMYLARMYGEQEIHNTLSDAMGLERSVLVSTGGKGRPHAVKRLVGLYNFSGGYKAFAHDINEAYRQDKETRRGLAAAIYGHDTWADFAASISDDTTREQAATIDALRAQVAAIAEERDDLMKRCDTLTSDLATLREFRSNQAQTIKHLMQQTDELRARLEDEPIEVNAVEEDGEALLRRVMLGVINDIRADPITRVNVAQEYARLGPVRKQQPVVQNDGFFSVTSAEQLYPTTTTANTNGGVEAAQTTTKSHMLHILAAAVEPYKRHDISILAKHLRTVTGDKFPYLCDYMWRLHFADNMKISDVFTSSAPGSDDFPKSAAAYFAPVHSGTSAALTEGQAAARELAATVPTDTRERCPHCGGTELVQREEGSRSCARCGLHITQCDA